MRPLVYVILIMCAQFLQNLFTLQMLLSSSCQTENRQKIKKEQIPSFTLYSTRFPYELDDRSYTQIRLKLHIKFRHLPAYTNANQKPNKCDKTDDLKWSFTIYWL